jgi:DNA replication protein DnaC
MREKICQLLIDLRLKGMQNVVDRELEAAEKKGTAIQKVLYRLLCQELAYRQQRSMHYRLNHAKIPFDWTLKTFPFDKQPGVQKSQMMSLAGLAFIERAENIVFIGNPGTGKSGLAIGLLRTALINGYRGRFYNAQDLLDELYASLADRSTPKLIKRLCNYGKAATIITTNLDYPDWYELFQRKTLVDALLDRLKHRCITININGPSLRAPTQKNATTASPKSA